MPKDDAFPKKLFVKREEDGDTVIFLADEDQGAHAIVNDTVTIGVYKLQKEVALYAWPTTDEDE
jgi:hypothetical protein